MTEEIKKILDDLYMADPTLKNQEEKLIKLIEKFIELKPDTKFDAEFARKLKQEILKETAISKFNWQEFFKFNPKNFYVLSGSFAILFLAFAVYFTMFFPVRNLALFNKSAPTKLAISNTVTKTSQEAFGALPSFEITQNQSENNVPEKAGGLGGRTDLQATTMLKASAPMSDVASSKMPASLIYPPVPRTTYTYTYLGEEVKLENQNLAVYKREQNGNLANQLGKIVGKIDTGLVNLNTFSNLKVNNIGLQENFDGGYSLNFDLQNENLSFYRISNAVAETTCAEKTNCIPPYYITKDQLPSDTEIIAVANKFLSIHGVDLSLWGTPQINKDWMNYDDYKNNGYVPSNISIVYPQKVSNQVVYNENGVFDGMSVNINLKENKVDSVYNLTSAEFVGSEYPAITDWKKVLDFALKGGVRPTIYYIMAPQGEEKQVNLDLGTPTVGLVKRWIYNNTSQELFVPAMVFPIKNLPDNTSVYNAPSVIVPLIEEMWPKNNDNTGIYPLRADGVSGSAIQGQTISPQTILPPNRGLIQSKVISK